MILAEKISQLRKKNGWSQEELAEKLNVSRQSVSKWESSLSTPDLERILTMSKLFGVSTDFLLKDEIEENEYCDNIIESEDTETSLKRVSMAEAREFINVSIKYAQVMSYAVAGCVFSPVLLIFMLALSVNNTFGVGQDMAVIIGLVGLIAIVAVCVAFIIYFSLPFGKYEYLEKEEIELEYGVAGFVREQKQLFQNKFSLGIVIGVVLCIVAVIPVIVSAFLDDSGALTLIFVALLIAIVAVAVHIFVKVCIIMGAYQKLLQEGDYTPEKKLAKDFMEGISSIYWCLVVALYLLLSFLTKRWDITWLIWPVAAMLYGAIYAILGIVKKK